MTSEDELSRIFARLALAETDEEEEDIGRSELASLLFHAKPALVHEVVKLAKRDNRMRRCLSAARYYSGLKKETCDTIDAVLRAPFRPPNGRADG